MDFECFMHFYEGLDDFRAVCFVNIDIFDCFWAICRSFWATKGLLWDQNGNSLGEMGPKYGHFAAILNHFWGHFGVSLGSFWDHFGIVLASIWGRFGDVLTSF